jgi:hypothetical protein
MAELSLRLRVLLFLYGSKNLAGCSLALAGLVLFFLGIINDWWFPITAGLYLAGWLATPRDEGLEFDVRSEATHADLLGSLDDLLAQSQGRLPREAMNRLERIRTIIHDLAPRILSGEMSMEHAIALTHAMTRDLPETIANYLRLPKAFATMHDIQGGKTCKALLLEQLDLLDTYLARMAESIHMNDADALLANGRFLKEKFHALSFVSA